MVKPTSQASVCHLPVACDTCIVAKWYVLPKTVWTVE